MRIAAIDIGTNSVHMIVCQIRPDLSFEVIDREKDMIRLGAGSLGGRALTASHVAAALQTLAKYKRLAESHGVDEVIAAGTSAVREAENGADFIAAVRREVGIHVRVISGTEEARLIHLAAAYAVGVTKRPVVVIDIGGGSTEITLGSASRVQFGRSFKLGVIRLAERFAQSDPLKGSDERRLERHVQRETRSYIRQLRRRGFERVIGTSGTILSLGALAAGAKRPPGEVRNVRVSVKALERLRRRLTTMTLDQRLHLSGLDPRRADLAAPGAVLLHTLLTELRADELMLCDFALREGLVLDYVQKNASHIRTVDRYPDVRRRSAMELAERFGYRAAHSRQVTKLALEIFDATTDLHRLGAREREWLEYGAILHDIGTHISYERHHKHSYYLIKNGDLRGFEPNEIEIIALTARYHRQAEPKKTHDGFADLPASARRTVRTLGAIVRLAEGLDRSHAQVIQGLSLGERGKTLKITLKSTGDAELELWAAHRHASALSATLGHPIEFDVSRSLKASPKDAPAHVEHARHSPFVPRKAVRRGGHRRLGQDHATGPAREVARGVGPSSLRH